MSTRTSIVTPTGWYERRVLLADTVLAAVLTLLLYLPFYFGEGWSNPFVLSSLLLIGPLMVRRTWPMVAVTVIAVIALVQVLGAPDAISPLSAVCVAIAVHTAARYAPRWFGYAALGLSAVGAVLAAVRWGNEYAPPEDIVVAALVMAGICAGSYVLGRSQLAKADAIDNQMRGLAERNQLIEKEHQQAVRIAMEEERGRLAAETHDILAHSLAIIVSQADGALMIARENTERVHEALEQIAETSRGALDEVRARVASLRRGDDPSADLEPAKSIADLPELLAAVGRAGLSADLEAPGGLPVLPPGLSLSAYRITQEALTNVLKHAGSGVRARVQVRRDDDLLRLTIRDDGVGPSADDGGGNGLAGMRARVAQYGGRLDVGGRPGEGFVIDAVLPLPARHTAAEGTAPLPTAQQQTVASPTSSQVAAPQAPPPPMPPTAAEGPRNKPPTAAEGPSDERQGGRSSTGSRSGQ